jgi:hypothetical protein
VASLPRLFTSNQSHLTSGDKMKTPTVKLHQSQELEERRHFLYLGFPKLIKQRALYLRDYYCRKAHIQVDHVTWRHSSFEQRICELRFENNQRHKI